MKVYYNNCNNTTFAAGKDDTKNAEKKVVTGGGAVAAAAGATRVKAARSGFDMFASSKKVSQGMSQITNSTRAINNTIKRSTSLWAKVCENARWAKNAIIKWGSKFKNMRMIKPLIESRLFRGCAGALGYGFGLVTLISGCSDIAKVASDAAQGHLLDKEA